MEASGLIFSEKKAKSAKIRLAINLKILALIVPVVLGSLFFCRLCFLCKFFKGYF